MDRHVRIQRVDFSRVGLEIVRVVIADEDSFGSIPCKLVGCCSAVQRQSASVSFWSLTNIQTSFALPSNTHRAVAAGYDDDFPFNSWPIGLAGDSWNPRDIFELAKILSRFDELLDTKYLVQCSISMECCHHCLLIGLLTSLNCCTRVLGDDDML